MTDKTYSNLCRVASSNECSGVRPSKSVSMERSLRSLSCTTTLRAPAAGWDGSASGGSTNVHRWHSGDGGGCSASAKSLDVIVAVFSLVETTLAASECTVMSEWPVFKLAAASISVLAVPKSHAVGKPSTRKVRYSFGLRLLAILQALKRCCERYMGFGVQICVCVSKPAPRGWKRLSHLLLNRNSYPSAPRCQHTDFPALEYTQSCTHLAKIPEAINILLQKS